jgi:hypothetical protein
VLDLRAGDPDRDPGDRCAVLDRAERRRAAQARPPVGFGQVDLVLELGAERLRVGA